MVEVGLVRVKVALSRCEKRWLNIGPFLVAIDEVELAVGDMVENRGTAATQQCSVLKQLNSRSVTPETTSQALACAHGARQGFWLPPFECRTPVEQHGATPFVRTAERYGPGHD